MTGSNSLRLTVAISLFNYGHYIAETLASVCRQSIAQAIELIVVDDASTDDSLHQLARFQAEHAALFTRLGAFRCERHPHNRGLAEARNTAFALASTPAVLVLDADNTLLPQAAACLEAALQAAPPMWVLFTRSLPCRAIRTRPWPTSCPGTPSGFAAAITSMPWPWCAVRHGSGLVGLCTPPAAGKTLISGAALWSMAFLHSSCPSCWRSIATTVIR